MLLRIHHAAVCHSIYFSIQTTFELKRKGELHRLQTAYIPRLCDRIYNR